MKGANCRKLSIVRDIYNVALGKGRSLVISVSPCKLGCHEISGTTNTRCSHLTLFISFFTREAEVVLGFVLSDAGLNLTQQDHNTR